MTAMHPLREYRHKAKKTLADLAREVGASKSTISRIETGEISPTLDLIVRLKVATGGALTADDFLPQAE